MVVTCRYFWVVQWSCVWLTASLISLLRLDGYVGEYITSKPLLRYGLSQFSSEFMASWGGHK